MEPLVFEPYLRPQIWGGRRLADWGQSLPAGNVQIGECWELSGHPLHTSCVFRGPLTGTTLRELWSTERRALVGDDPKLLSSDRFPWLVKLLNCEAPLSVQVHPGPHHARQLGLTDPGKSEAWVVLESSPTARIYAGLRSGVDRPQFEKALAAGLVVQQLHTLHPEVGDCLYLPSGTIHSAQGGLVLLEVQSTSDATFRLWDWERVDATGKSRPLHREQGLELVDWSLGPLGFGPSATMLPLAPGVTRTQLVACPEFQLHRYELQAGHRPTELSGKMTVWFVTAGAVGLRCENFPMQTISRGQTVLVPATSPPIGWDVSEGPASLIAVMR